MKTLKLLISAYACEKGKGSESGVGWNWVRQISRFADDVWVITRANNRKVIKKALEEEPLPNVHWVFFDLPSWARFWKKGRRGVHLYYYLWQIGIYFVARRLHKEVKFDLIHHVTFVNYWMPSFLALLPVPFIWGPVGGGESAPRTFLSTFSLKGQLYEHMRDLARRLGEFDPFTKITARRSIMALATTKETLHRLMQLGVRHTYVLSQVALPEEEIAKLSIVPFRTGEPFRLLSMGRLLHWKGFHLGLMAFAQFVRKFRQSEYWLVGDGPERCNLEHLSRELGIGDKVRFFGALPREEALKRLGECDVLVHPSLHDSGGWVCAEAMAAGRPVICLDLGGPSLQVTENTGFKIPARSPEQAVKDMAEAMMKLATNEILRRKMGEAARRRVMKEFSWDKKREEIKQIYYRLINNE